MPSCRVRVLARSLFVFSNRRLFSIAVGDSARLTKSFTQQDVINFASLCGDTNPIHVDDQFAQSTKFGRCIVHGALVNGLVSALLGTQLPGPGCVVVSQHLEFPSPLFVGQVVTAEVKVTRVKKKIIETDFECIVGKRDAIVLKGNAKLMLMK